MTHDSQPELTAETRIRLLGEKTIREIIQQIDAKEEQNNFRWESFSATLLKSLQTARVFVDCGAEFGFYTYLALQRYPNCKVIAFEPEPARFQLLKHFFGGYSNAVIYPYALADHAGEITVYKPGDSASCTIDKNLSQYDNLRVDGTKVPTVALDDILKDMPVDVVKMDIEGAEVLAFAGMSGILKVQRPLIYIEMHSKYIQSIKKDGVAYIAKLLQDARYIITDDSGCAKSLSGRVVLVPEEKVTRPAKKITMEINEKATVQEILAKLKPLNHPRIMINIGASNGYEAKPFAEKGWSVFAFEANPCHFPAFNAGFSGPNMHRFCKAVALDDSDTVTFYVSEKHPGIGTLKPFDKTHEPIEVEAVSLQKVYAEHGITKIDYFMIDAEFMDLAIMKTHNWSIPIAALFMEFTNKNIEDIYTYVISQVPAYKHLIFEWEKPYDGFGVAGSPPAKCVRVSTIEEYRKEPRGKWGNILFHLPY